MLLLCVVGVVGVVVVVVVVVIVNVYLPKPPARRALPKRRVGGAGRAQRLPPQSVPSPLLVECGEEEMAQAERTETFF